MKEAAAWALGYIARHNAGNNLCLKFVYMYKTEVIIKKVNRKENYFCQTAAAEMFIFTPLLHL